MLPIVTDVTEYDQNVTDSKIGNIVTEFFGNIILWIRSYDILKV